jgi:hypothetical protein
MKNLILLLSILFSLSSCSQNDEEKIENSSIVGTWKLIEKIKSGNDGLPTWESVSEAESYTYVFYNDGKIINSLNENNCNGLYEVNTSNTILNIKYNCNSSQVEGSFKLTLDNNNLILSPNPNPCDEGCAQKFVKIQQQ